jgi:hypothetical protein
MLSALLLLTHVRRGGCEERRFPPFLLSYLGTVAPYHRPSFSQFYQGKFLTREETNGKRGMLHCADICQRDKGTHFIKLAHKGLVDRFKTGPGAEAILVF